MAFLPVKSDHGAVPPFEYLPAAAGTYHAGQLVEVNNGKVQALAAAATETPPYLCMREGTLVDGELIPLIRVSHDYIYETTLDAEMTTAKPGAKVSVKAGGLFPAAAAGSFELTAVEGTAAGCCLRGRFL